MEDPLLPEPVHHLPAEPTVSLAGLSLDEAPPLPSMDQAEPAKSRAASPRPNAPEALKENPFDSEGSRILFDAMDQLQSCIGDMDSAEIDIPQLVICGGQSTGKSSLLQSLTDIPFPADTGCCTRFATRIVSRRTPAYSENKFKITIVEPDIKIDGFGYPASDLHKEYVHAGQSLSPLEFLRVMEDVTTKYMGIVKGQGPDKKNFATQVLRIELSGPSRSHFSILDVPGVFSSSHAVNPGEMEGVKDMVVKYMKKPENIVICVADAMTDLACQETFNLAARHVERKRLVSVFTKCDLQPNPNEVVAIVTGKQEETARFLGNECFVVRNRTSRDDGRVDLAQLEGDLFGRAPWTLVPRERRGSDMLRAYLSQLLCRQISDRFPAIQAGIQQRLATAQAARHALGHARTTHQDNKQYLMNVVQGYEDLARKSLEKPGQVGESMRLRGLLKDANEGFAKTMHEAGHLFEFENADMDAKSALKKRKAKFQRSLEEPTLTWPFAPSADQRHQPLFSPPVTPPKEPQRPARPRKNKERAAQPASGPIFEHIRATSRSYQSTQLPGLINPDVLPDLFLKQTEKWPALAEAHLDAVAAHVSNTVLAVLQRSCPGEGGTRIAHDELWRQLHDSHETALTAARRKVRQYCHQERASILQTTDPRFLDALRALRTIRLLDSLDALQGPAIAGTQDPALYFDCLHYSIDDNMVKDVHDVLKVYYQISIEGFTRHVTHIIIEQFVNDPTGPLRGLSRDWVYGLDEEAVWKIAREDKETLAERRRHEDVIEKLQCAQHVSETARARVASLEG